MKHKTVKASESPGITGQSRQETMVEVALNTVIGYVVALLSQLTVFPLMGVGVSLSTNLWIGVWFTLISVVRGYVVRRWFNTRLKNTAVKIAGRGSLRRKE